MNEEWWGISAKGYPDSSGLYEVYPRAAYYALQQAFALDPYAPGTDIAQSARTSATFIRPVARARGRGNTASAGPEATSRVRLSGRAPGVRDLQHRRQTASARLPRRNSARHAVPGVPGVRPHGVVLRRLRGATHRRSHRHPVAEHPRARATATHRRDLLREPRASRRPSTGPDGEVDLSDIERVKVYRASVNWDDRWFHLDGFYRTGHLHWGYEGDFFGLYRDAFYGENIDIYNGQAPVGYRDRRQEDAHGLKVAFGPQLWWGANPAVFVKYNHRLWQCGRDGHLPG